VSSLLDRFDEFQQRRAWLALPMAVVKKAGDDQGGNLAALVAYYGFFSLFPLLLVFTTIIGYVLAGNPAQQESVKNSIVNQFPSVGQSLHFQAISGSAVALIVGIVVSLYAGLGVTNAAQNLMNTVWAVPFRDRPSFVKSRLRGLALLVSLGTLFIVSTVITGAVSSVFGGADTKLFGYLVSIAVNACLFFFSFRWMTDSEVRSRDLLWGTFVGAILWTILQAVGGIYLHHVSSGGHYGVFTTVIGMLVWLHLGGQVLMYCAEINVVVSRHLWPRSFFGPPLSSADQRVLRDLAKAAARTEHQTVDVGFRESATADPEAPSAADPPRRSR
jgi:membrane protein